MMDGVIRAAGLDQTRTLTECREGADRFLAISLGIGRGRETKAEGCF